MDILIFTYLSLGPTPCSMGYYQPLTSQTSCLQCPMGNECLDGMAATSCPAGTASVAGQANCTACDSGTYAASPGAGLCVMCPAGFRCGYATSVPQHCPSGQYSSAGSSDCVFCPAGFVCESNATVTPTLCTNGTYSLLGSSTCGACPAGHYCSLPSEGIPLVLVGLCAQANLLL